MVDQIAIDFVYNFLFRALRRNEKGKVLRWAQTEDYQYCKAVWLPTKLT